MYCDPLAMASFSCVGRVRSNDIVEWQNEEDYVASGIHLLSPSCRIRGHPREADTSYNGRRS